MKKKTKIIDMIPPLVILMVFLWTIIISYLIHQLEENSITIPNGLKQDGCSPSFSQGHIINTAWYSPQSKSTEIRADKIGYPIIIICDYPRANK